MNLLLDKIHNLWYKFHRFGTFLYKMCQYGKLLWKDYDFDYIYILELLRLKLKRTRVSLENSQILEQETLIKRLKVCELLLDRIIEDDYTKLEYRLIEEKWGPFKQGKFLTREKVITRADKKDYRADIIKIGLRSEYLKQQDINYLFKTMSKYIQVWWS